MVLGFGLGTTPLYTINMKNKNILIFVLASLILSSNLSLCQLNSPKYFSFKVTEISNDSSTSYEDKIFKIDIYNSKTNEFIQSIEHKIESIWYNYSLEIDSTNLEDVNFDEYKDLILPTGQGEMGRNEIFTIYLFDSLQNKFHYCQSLSDICNIRVNSEDKTIDELIFNGGDPNYTLTTYEVIKDSLVIKKIITQHFDIIETLYYENGKFLYKEIETVQGK